MNTQSPVSGGGFNLNFGGIFTSAPAAVMMNAHRPPVADPGTLPSTPLPAAPVVRPGGPFIGLPPTPLPDLRGPGLDYAMYHYLLRGASYIRTKPSHNGIGSTDAVVSPSISRCCRIPPGGKPCASC